MEECSGFRVILRGIYLCFFVYIIMKKHILKQENHKENRLSTLFDVNKRFCFGGEGGIRTLDELLTHTRVPVVRHKPGQATSPVYYFKYVSPYLSDYNIIAHHSALVNTFSKNFLFFSVISINFTQMPTNVLSFNSILKSLHLICFLNIIIEIFRIVETFSPVYLFIL